MPGIVFGENNGFVVSRRHGWWRAGERKAAFLVAGAVLLVALAAGGAAYYVTGREPGLSIDQQVERANAAGDYDKAVALRRSQQSPDAEAQIELAMAYGNAKQYDQALAIFDRLLAAGQLNSVYMETAAGLAADADDKPKAIGYYKAARQKVLEEKAVTAESRIETYNKRITELGGQP